MNGSLLIIIPNFYIGNLFLNVMYKKRNILFSLGKY